jgi:DNA-binding MarR family transcriptional regulator
MTRGFTRVPNALVHGEVCRADGQRLSDGAFRLYVVILDYSRCGERSCIAAQERFAKDLDISTRTVRKWLDELDDAGLIKRKRTSRTATTTIDPTLIPERKSASARDWKQPSGKEDAQREEEVSSQSSPSIEPLRRGVAQ